MLEINIYSIIDFNVFGVTIGVNFLLAIIEYRFNDCKHVVKVERMQLGSIGGVWKLKYRSHWYYRGERMKFDYTSSKNGRRCKRLREWMKIKNNFKRYIQCKVSWATSYCLNF
jgi:hypothetical protein